MKSKTKLTLSVTAMVAITLLAVVSIMAVFAARQQSFSTSISVVYHSTSVEGTASAQWKLGSYTDYGDGTGYWNFYSDWQNMDSNGSGAGGETQLDLSSAGPLSLSPQESINLSDENPAVVLKYSFTNTASHPFTLNFNYQATNTTKNINSFYAASSQEIDDGNLGDISNNFTNMLETTVLGETSENIYILLKIDDWGSDSMFDGTFNIKLDGITSEFNEDYIYLYDGTNAMLTGAVDKEATTFDASTVSYKGAPVTRIGDGAFQDNTSLEAVTLNGIEDIGMNAFSGCSSITSMTIGKELKHSGPDAFAGFTNLTSLNYNAVDAAMEKNHDIVFKGLGRSGSGATVVIGNDVLSIPDGFCGWDGGNGNWSTKVISLTLGEKVKTIGNAAFRRNSDITSLIIPESVTSIGDMAFSLCYGITSVFIPKNVSEIGQQAFENRYLTNLTVDSANPNFTSRDDDGNECNVLIEKATKTAILAANTASIPDGIINISAYAFSGSTKDTLIIPDSVQNIGDCAFRYCVITSITIPQSVVGLGYDVFDSCYRLAEILNKSMVADGSIGGYGKRIIHEETEKGDFNTVNGVIYYSYENNVIAIGLEDVNKQGEIILQPNTTAIKGYAFYSCAGITNVIIPESVSIIGSSAFTGCTGLTSVTINCGEEVCNNLMNWCANLEYSLQVGGTMRAKYEINGLLDWSNMDWSKGERTYFTKSDDQIEGYWVYTKNKNSER